MNYIFTNDIDLYGEKSGSLLASSWSSMLTAGIAENFATSVLDSGSTWISGLEMGGGVSVNCNDFTSDSPETQFSEGSGTVTTAAFLRKRTEGCSTSTVLVCLCLDDPTIPSPPG